MNTFLCCPPIKQKTGRKFFWYHFVMLQSSCNITNGAKNSRMGQVKFMEDSLQKMLRDMICLSRPYPFKFFRDCLSQILLGPFLKTLSQVLLPNPWTLNVIWMHVRRSDVSWTPSVHYIYILYLECRPSQQLQKVKWHEKNDTVTSCKKSSSEPVRNLT